MAAVTTATHFQNPSECRCKQEFQRYRGRDSPLQRTGAAHAQQRLRGGLAAGVLLALAHRVVALRVGVWCKCCARAFGGGRTLPNACCRQAAACTLQNAGCRHESTSPHMQARRAATSHLRVHAVAVGVAVARERVVSGAPMLARASVDVGLRLVKLAAAAWQGTCGLFGTPAGCPCPQQAPCCRIKEAHVIRRVYCYSP